MTDANKIRMNIAEEIKMLQMIQKLDDTEIQNWAEANSLPSFHSLANADAEQDDCEESDCCNQTMLKRFIIGDDLVEFGTIFDDMYYAYFKLNDYSVSGTLDDVFDEIKDFIKCNILKI
ncbi:hypothetical protein [Ruminococcus callidus]|nr:hypothetical protein [Ruminococcus callidus]